jgi:hypothetical protein
VQNRGSWWVGTGFGGERKRGWWLGTGGGGWWVELLLGFRVAAAVLGWPLFGGLVGRCVGFIAADREWPLWVEAGRWRAEAWVVGCGLREGLMVGCCL